MIATLAFNEVIFSKIGDAQNKPGFLITDKLEKTYFQNHYCERVGYLCAFMLTLNNPLVARNSQNGNIEIVIKCSLYLWVIPVQSQQ